MKQLLLPLSIVLFLISCSNEQQPTPSFTGDEYGMNQFKKELDLKGFEPSKDSLISQFAQLTTLDSTSEAYWKVIKIGKPYIYQLIFNIKDTTPTRIYSKCLDDYLNVGDVCLNALENIVELPTYAVFGFQTCIFDQECWPFDSYSHEPKNKKKIQHDVTYFWENNQFDSEPLDKFQSANFKKKMGITHILKYSPETAYKSDPAPF